MMLHLMITVPEVEHGASFGLVSDGSSATTRGRLTWR